MFTATGYSLIMNTSNYHKSFKLYGSDDKYNWTLVKEFLFPTEPTSERQYIQFDYSIMKRYYKIFTNDTRYDALTSLSIESLDFYGNILWDYGYTCKKRIRRSLNLFFLQFCLI